jgi:hypothetical protein
MRKFEHFQIQRDGKVGHNLTVKIMILKHTHTRTHARTHTHTHTRTHTRTHTHTHTQNTILRKNISVRCAIFINFIISSYFSRNFDLFSIKIKVM